MPESTRPALDVQLQHYGTVLTRVLADERRLPPLELDPAPVDLAARRRPGGAWPTARVWTVSVAAVLVVVLVAFALSVRRTPDVGTSMLGDDGNPTAGDPTAGTATSTTVRPTTTLDKATPPPYATPRMVASFLPAGLVPLRVGEQPARPATWQSPRFESFTVGPDPAATLTLLIQDTHGAPAPAAVTDVVAGAPGRWTDVATGVGALRWLPPGADVEVGSNALTRPQVEGALAQLRVRPAGAPAGFDGGVDPAGPQLLHEFVAPDGWTWPATSVAAYGPAAGAQATLVVHASAGAAGAPKDLDLVSLPGAQREVIGGRARLVTSTTATDVTVAWYEDDGTVVTLHATGMIRADVDRVIAGVHPADAAAWRAIDDAAAAVVQQAPGQQDIELANGHVVVHGPAWLNLDTARGGSPRPVGLCFTPGTGSATGCQSVLADADLPNLAVAPGAAIGSAPAPATARIVQQLIDGRWWVFGVAVDERPLLLPTADPQYARPFLVLQTDVGPGYVTIQGTGEGIYFFAGLLPTRATRVDITDVAVGPDPLLQLFRPNP